MGNQSKQKSVVPGMCLNGSLGQWLQENKNSSGTEMSRVSGFHIRPGARIPLASPNPRRCCNTIYFGFFSVWTLGRSLVRVASR